MMQSPALPGRLTQLRHEVLALWKFIAAIAVIVTALGLSAP